MKLYAVILLLLANVSLCGAVSLKNVEAAAVSEQTTSSQSHYVQMVAEKQASPVSAAGAYDELVERYRALVLARQDYTDIVHDDELGVFEAANSLGNNAVHELGYLIEDLSGDGVPELVVGKLNGEINALYTLQEGVPQFVFKGLTRSSYSYLGDGRFYYNGAGGAAATAQGVFRLAANGMALECDSFHFTALNSDGGIDVYYNETGSWDPAESQKTAMSAEDFLAYNPAVKLLPLTPFARVACKAAAKY